MHMGHHLRKKHSNDFIHSDKYPTSPTDGRGGGFTDNQHGCNPCDLPHFPEWMVPPPAK